MPVDERTRRVMTDGLVRALGEEVTDALMAHLPQVGWADVATKQDLVGLGVATKQDLEGLRVATKQDLEGLRVATTKDLEKLADRLRADMADLRAEFHQELRIAISQQTRTLVWAQLGTVLTVAVMAFGAARLI